MGPLLSWALYDFANTIFSAIVLTVYFPLYLTELTGSNWSLGTATTISMVLAGLVVPFMGALSDQTGKTKTYLVRTTLICIFFLALISLTKNPLFLIAAFIVSCFFYHAALVFYNSLLPVAAPPEKQGFASGLGTGLGYLGVVIALPIAHWVDRSWGRPPVFIAAAALFLLFSLPTFLGVPERRIEKPIPFQWSLWPKEWKKIFSTVQRLRDQPKLFLFLAGNFFAVAALNSMIFWFSVYTRGVFHPGQDKIILLLMSVNAAAFAWGIVTGILTDRIGSLQTMILATGVLALSLALLAIIPDFWVFAATAILGGSLGIAGIWTAGRKALVELVPKEQLGEYFGLYGLTTKISVIGSLLFSVVADLAGFRAALWLLVFPASAGFLCLIRSRILRA